MSARRMSSAIFFWNDRADYVSTGKVSRLLHSDPFPIRALEEECLFAANRRCGHA